jgi:phosphomannomutase
VVVRPSGTEPKLKAYIEVVVEPRDDVASSREEAQGLVALIRSDLAAVLAL